MLSVLSVTQVAETQGRSSALVAHHGVIVGRVVDTSSQPVPDVLVVPLWEMVLHAGKTVHPVSVRLGSITNANGEYRIDTLTPGPYYLVALPRNVPRNQRLAINSESYRFGYAITYYPSATRVAKATRIEVGDKPVAAGNIIIASAHLAQITGIAITSNGQPAHGGIGRVARPFGFAPTDPSMRLSRTRLFPRWIRISKRAPPACGQCPPGEEESARATD